MYFSRPAGHKYIDRGDPADADFSQADLIQDNTWRLLDLSLVVGTGVKLLVIYTYFDNDVSLSYISFRQAGNSNPWNSDGVFNHVIGVAGYETILVICDADGKIEYKSGSTDNKIDGSVRGWFA